MMQSNDYLEENSGTVPDAPDGKKTLSRNARLIIGISASVVILALGLASAFLMPSLSTPELSLTVFSNDWAENTLKSGVETALNEYLASDSSVPGFPLRVSCVGTDDILLSVDAGSLFTWGAPDYVADSKGQEYAAQTDETVYWSPYSADKTLVAQCTLTVTARKGGSSTSQMRLIIRQTGETSYSITQLVSE